MFVEKLKFLIKNEQKWCKKEAILTLKGHKSQFFEFNSKKWRPKPI